MAEIIDYSGEYEPWFCFVDNIGFGGFDSPYDMNTPTTKYPDDYVKTFLAREHHLIVGYVGLSEECSFGLEWKGKKALEINGIAVLPPYRKQGIGRELIKAAAKWASANGYDKLYAFLICDARRDLHDFYGNLGFRLESTQVGLDVAGEPQAQMSAESYWTYLQSTKEQHHKISWVGFVYALDLKTDGTQLSLGS